MQTSTETVFQIALTSLLNELKFGQVQVRRDTGNLIWLHWYSYVLELAAIIICSHITLWAAIAISNNYSKRQFSAHRRTKALEPIKRQPGSSTYEIWITWRAKIWTDYIRGCVFPSQVGWLSLPSFRDISKMRSCYSMRLVTAAEDCVVIWLKSFSLGGKMRVACIIAQIWTWSFEAVRESVQ